MSESDSADTCGQPAVGGEAANPKGNLVAKGRFGDDETRRGGWEPNDEKGMRDKQGDLAVGQSKLKRRW